MFVGYIRQQKMMTTMMMIRTRSTLRMEMIVMKTTTLELCSDWAGMRTIQYSWYAVEHAWNSVFELDSYIAHFFFFFRMLLISPIHQNFIPYPYTSFKLLFLIHKQLFAMPFQCIFPWTVYCEGPPSFIWGEGEPKRWHYYSSLQFTYTFKTLQ